MSAVHCDETRCLVNYVRKLRAQKMMHGRVSQVGDTFVLTVSMTDVSSAEVDALVTRMIHPGIDNVLRKISPGACELLSDALAREACNAGVCHSQQ